MKRILPICLIAIIWFAVKSKACLNEYGNNIYGHSETRSELNGRGDNTALLRLKHRKDQLENTLRSEGGYKNLSDYAAILLRLGKKDTAMHILRRLALQHPFEYNIAANIGTGYELIGKDDSALFWLNRAVKIMPNSHLYSEWIHLKVLEAKLAIKKDPQWLRTHDILGFNFGKGVKPYYQQGFKRDKEQLSYQLIYQIHERTYFINPPNDIVAELLRVLGDLQYLRKDNEKALEAYRLAYDYATDSKVLISAKIAMVNNDPPVEKNEMTTVPEDHHDSINDLDTSPITFEDTNTVITPVINEIVEKEDNDEKNGTIAFFRTFFLAILVVLTAGIGIYFFRQRKK